MYLDDFLALPDEIDAAEHGWCSLWSRLGGHEPAMVAS